MLTSERARHVSAMPGSACPAWRATPWSTLRPAGPGTTPASPDHR